MDKWMARTNGIDGEEKGLELDALTSDQIREIFVNGIEPFIDSDKYTQFVKEAFLKQLFLKKSKSLFERAWTHFKAQYLEATELIDFDVIDLALDGKSSIHVDRFAKIEIPIDKKQINDSYQFAINQA